MKDNKIGIIPLLILTFSCRFFRERILNDLVKALNFLNAMHLTGDSMHLGGGVK